MADNAAQSKGASAIDRRIAKALSHPTRIEILTEVNKAPMSPKEFERLRGGALSGISYHFRELAKLGCLELIDTRQVRGSTEHYYQAADRAWITDEGWAALPESIRTGLDTTVYRTFLHEIVVAIESGTMEARPDRCFAWTAARLDLEGWNSVMGKLNTLLAELSDEEVAAADRMAKSGEAPIQTTVGLIGFESPAPERGQPKVRKRS